MEICPDTFRSSGECILHFHIFWFHTESGKRRKKIRTHKDQKELLFLGRSPYSPDFHDGEAEVPENAEPCQNRRQRSTEKLRAGALFYIIAPKKGHITDFGNVGVSWSQVHPSSVTKLFADGKISEECTKICYLNCVTNAEHNVKQLDYVLKERGQHFMTQRMVQKREEVLKKLRPRLFIQVVEEVWLPGLVNLTDPRELMLILDGPSQLGKTNYARSLAEKDECFFECDCSNKEHPDLSELCNVKHRIALFDECTPKFVINNKRLMQGSIYGCTVGNSNTNQWCRRLNTWGVGIIIAANDWKQKLLDLDDVDKEWLKMNCIYVQVTRNLWLED